MPIDHTPSVVDTYLTDVKLLWYGALVVISSGVGWATSYMYRCYQNGFKSNPIVLTTGMATAMITASYCLPVFYHTYNWPLPVCGAFSAFIGFSWPIFFDLFMKIAKLKLFNFFGVSDDDIK